MADHDSGNVLQKDGQHKTGDGRYWEQFLQASSDFVLQLIARNAAHPALRPTRCSQRQICPPSWKRAAVVDHNMSRPHNLEEAHEEEIFWAPER